MSRPDSLPSFHPVVRDWFLSRFAAPTDAQREGWPAIMAGRDVLVSAPTGSGKTLAAFLASLDRLLARALEGTLERRTSVLYVSPLRALAGDIHRNLETPLAEMLALAGLGPGAIDVQTRTGDTPAGARERMIRRPPHVLVTTPESLYLLVTSARSREFLRTVETVIVDEIHALAPDRRGAHLALSLERLEALCDARPVRIGLSATAKPIEELARFLVGGARLPDVVDTGHVRERDLRIEVPATELGAVCTHEQWGEIYERLVALVEAHTSTLVFVNTRRLAERVAHQLALRVGEAAVLPHHGSLSHRARRMAETDLKEGRLKAVVATASLELGIDVGHVDLVCQMGSPGRSRPSSSGSGARGTRWARSRRGGSSRSPGTTSSSASRSWSRRGKGSSTRYGSPIRRSTSWRSRSRPRSPAVSGARTSSTSASAGPLPTGTSRARGSTSSSGFFQRAWPGDGDATGPSSTATG